MKLNVFSICCTTSILFSCNYIFLTKHATYTSNISSRIHTIKAQSWWNTQRSLHTYELKRLLTAYKIMEFWIPSGLKALYRADRGQSTYIMHVVYKVTLVAMLFDRNSTNLLDWVRVGFQVSNVPKIKENLWLTRITYLSIREYVWNISHEYSF